MARLRLAWAILACMSAIDVQKPYWCPPNTWKGICKYQATCESLAMAGLTCEGVALIDQCNVICAPPCCVTTSTTTRTSTATGTTISATQTTYTETHTETSSTTASVSQTSTFTISTTGTGSTVTRTATLTMPTTTEAPPTTTEGPAAVMRLAMRVKVMNPDDYIEYFEDARVKGAYLRVMSNITGVPDDQVGLDMMAQTMGNLTIIFTLTIPYMDNGTAMVPSVPLGPMQAKLMGMSIAGFNTMIQEAVDAATGEGTYSQQVLSVSEATGSTNDVSAACSGRLAIWVVPLWALVAARVRR